MGTGRREARPVGEAEGAGNTRPRARGLASGIERRHGHGARICCGVRTPTRIKIPVRHCGQRIGGGSAAAADGVGVMGGGSVGAGSEHGQERAGLIELATARGTPDPVVADLDATAREDVLEEASEKLVPVSVTRRIVLGPVVAIAEGDVAVSKGSVGYC